MNRDNYAETLDKMIVEVYGPETEPSTIWNIAVCSYQTQFRCDDPEKTLQIRAFTNGFQHAAFLAFSH